MTMFVVFVLIVAGLWRCRAAKLRTLAARRRRHFNDLQCRAALRDDLRRALMPRPAPAIHVPRARCCREAVKSCYVVHSQHGDKIIAWPVHLN